MCNLQDHSVSSARMLSFLSGTLSAIRLARASSSSSSEYGKRDRLPIEVALSIQGLGKGQEESLQKVCLCSDVYSSIAVSSCSERDKANSSFTPYTSMNGTWQNLLIYVSYEPVGGKQ